MNLLTNYKLLDDTFKSLAEEVLINGEPQQCIVTTAYLGIDESRHISSLQAFKRGDYVQHKGQTYLITEEVKSTRHNKYRAKMTNCDHSFVVKDLIGRVEVGKDSLGKPIYENIYSDPYSIYGHMKQWDRSLNMSFQVGMMQVTYFIDVQNNTKNREQFAINNVYEIRGKTMKVALHELSNDGIIGLLFLQSGAKAPY
ncbi:hypothetical protein [Sporosarcina limicola]|uniref:Uncharacterized protein n=1 Tax=Sporosarcina limicola TaxID=34101 RepID=A0A927MJH8_9BACL|nr:hypothetical protein [Sporosarcina limicola]MBE1555073.1 hypothetical protein [Sporosarcina limicola]